MTKNSFSKLDDYREVKILNNGKIIVIKPINNITITPIFCPVCKYPMKTSDDAISYKKYECCFKCDLTFASENQEKWLEGWRPSKEELELYCKEKEILSKTKIIIK